VTATAKSPLEDHVHWGAVMDKRHLIQQP